METFFSILSVPIRPEIQEKLTVGMLLCSDNMSFFAYSNPKLIIIKELISSNAYKLLKDSIKSIETLVKNTNSQNINGLNVFTTGNINAGEILSQGYIEYLSRYNNNLLTFTSPKSIQIECNEDNFNRLFYKFIDNEPAVTGIHPSINDFSRLRSSFFPSLTGFYNVNQELTRLAIPNLLMPVKIELIGKNEKAVYAQTIDFERNINLIDGDICKLILLNKAIPEGHGFLISKEPDQRKTKNHEIWENIRESSIFDYTDLSEVEKIKTYADQHGVLPFIEY